LFQRRKKAGFRRPFSFLGAETAMSAPGGASRARTKRFWFFFSKKNALRPSLVIDV
jgi:hypothetical protein